MAGQTALSQMLQWGRNITVAECQILVMDTIPEIQLQWGRNITVAECMWLECKDQHGDYASMGPQHHCCGVI